MRPAGSRSTADTTRATSAAAIGDVRPLANGSTSAPRSRIEPAASMVSSGFSMNTVGRTCTTGTPAQFMMCSASQCSRCCLDSDVLVSVICDTVICDMFTMTSTEAVSRATAQTMAVAVR